MTDAKLTGEGLRNAIVSMLSEEGVYPSGMSRAYIVSKRPGWMVGAIDNALHVLKKRCIVRTDGPEYVLTTAPDWYNKQILDEMNGGGAKAPEPAASVSRLDQKPLLSKQAHASEVKPKPIVEPKQPPRQTCSVDGCKNILPLGMKMCNACIEKHDFSDTDGPKLEEPTSGVKGCPYCGCGMPADFTKCPSKLCPSNEPTVYGTDESSDHGDEPFLWVDIGAALKELEQKLADKPAPVEIDQLELKLDLLADLERLLDARIKPVLKAIAGDLVRCSGGE